MTDIYLFDWGDTLMVDIPGQTGKMCDWEHVEAVDGARDALEHLSLNNHVYVATNAVESSPADVESALERVGLARYIHGYFCRANLGISKGTPAYYQAILEQLDTQAQDVTMVGDSMENDISPALDAGLQAVWLTPDCEFQPHSDRFKRIAHLRELCPQ